MFSRIKKIESHPLDETIQKLISEIQIMDAGDEAHTNAITALKTLMEIRNADKVAAKTPFVNPEVLITAVAHLTGIIIILGFEKANVITSKSLGFVPKIKL